MRPLYPWMLALACQQACLAMFLLPLITVKLFYNFRIIRSCRYATMSTLDCQTDDNNEHTRDSKVVSLAADVSPTLPNTREITFVALFLCHPNFFHVMSQIVFYMK